MMEKAEQAFTDSLKMLSERYPTLKLVLMSRPAQDRKSPGARTADYEFELPPELIATHPAEKREQSRLLVYHRADGPRGASALCRFAGISAAGRSAGAE